MKPIIFALLSLGCTGCNDPDSDTVPLVTSEAVMTAPELYALYCAQCHGQHGDGVGFIELDRPARSFVDGGFSFGNTLRAIEKTTASGIPGTPMPPFADVLNAHQIKLVSEHVQSFAAMLKEATPDETEMTVMERPIVVRGMVPPIHEGLDLHPRGLVIGNPDRFSYEYRVDDVRLLTIRQGLFVRRADWGERGGSPLELLGKVVVEVGKGNPSGMFKTVDNIPLLAQLTSTNTLGDYGEIRYDLIHPNGEIVASITEHCVPTTGTRTLVEQHLLIDSTEAVVISAPNGTDISNAPFIPMGKHTFIITHAIYGSGAVVMD